MQPSVREKGKGRYDMADFVTIHPEDGMHSSRKESELPICDVAYVANDKQVDDAAHGGSNRSHCP
jgi:hypothetical protein